MAEKNINNKAQKYIEYIFNNNYFFEITDLLNPERYREKKVTLQNIVDFFEKSLLPNGVATGVSQR